MMILVGVQVRNVSVTTMFKLDLGPTQLPYPISIRGTFSADKTAGT